MTIDTITLRRVNLGRHNDIDDIRYRYILYKEDKMRGMMIRGCAPTIDELIAADRLPTLTVAEICRELGIKEAE